jgi:hypothetical protein
MPYKDPEKRREHKRLRYHINKERYYVKYREENKEKLKERSKKYYQNNKEKLKERRGENKEKYNKWEREKRKNNPLYKFKKNFTNKLRKSLKLWGGKNSRTITILGLSINDFRLHLENQFEPWMNWDNYGLYNGEFNYGWDIDHIIPSSTATTMEEMVKLNHYTNLKPLCSKINRDIKRDLI